MDAAISEKLQTEELKLSFIYDSKIICLYGKTIKGKFIQTTPGSYTGDITMEPITAD